VRALPRKHRVWAAPIPSAPFSLHACFCFVQFSDVFVMRALPRNARFCAVLFPRLPSFLHACFLGLYYSVMCSLCFAFSSLTYVLVNCSINLELCYYARAVAHFFFCSSLFCYTSSPNALVRLLTLRLPSLEWCADVFC